MSTLKIIQKETYEVYWEGNKPNSFEFKNALRTIRSQSVEQHFIYTVDHREVPFHKAWEVANSLTDEFYAKREETKKQIFWHDGASGSLCDNTKRSAWVKK